MISKRRSVGLLLDEHHIVAAEVRHKAHGPAVARVAALDLADGLSWDTPPAVGQALGRFLHEKGFHAGGGVIVGMPAQWLVAARHNVPPVGRQQVTGILRLAAERAFSLGPGRAVCDCASTPPDGTAGAALLVATTRERLQAVRDALQAARLTPRAVTSATAALALAGRNGASDATVAATPDGVELVLNDNGRIVALRHIPTVTAGALRLALGAAAGAAGQEIHRVALWDVGGAAAAACADACRSLGVEIEGAPKLALDGLRQAASAGRVEMGRAAPAAALAAAGLVPALLPFDLLHSRLAERRQRRWVRTAAWAAALLVTLGGAAWVFMADQEARRRDIEGLRARLAANKPRIEAADRVVKSISVARGWYTRRPRFLDCLTALTLTFPENGGGIYATSVTVQQNMQGVLSGNATTERSVLDVLDALNESTDFDDVQLLIVRETRGATNEKSFIIMFTYVGEPE